MCLLWLSGSSFGEISQTPIRFCHSTRTHGTVFISFLHMLSCSPVCVTLHDQTHTFWSSFQPDCLPTLCCAWVATWGNLLVQNSCGKDSSLLARQSRVHQLVMKGSIRILLLLVLQNIKMFVESVYMCVCFFVCTHVCMFLCTWKCT